MKINKEGFKILGYTFAVVIVLMVAAVFVVPLAGMPIWSLWIIGGVFFLLLFFIACFFRDPKRDRPRDPELVFSGADGKIVVIEEVMETEFLNEKRIQVSIFMSLANVHVNWYPVGGTVVYRKDHPGEYMVAWHPKSSEENERMTTVVDTGKEKILFRQIAGYLARRIVNYAKEGQSVEQNTQCGFIKFGSRVDIFLPLDSEILVTPGQKVKGGITPVARLKT